MMVWKRNFLAHRIHVGNIYIHFPLNVAIFHLMQVNIPYMDPMGWNLPGILVCLQGILYDLFGMGG